MTYHAPFERRHLRSWYKKEKTWLCQIKTLEEDLAEFMSIAAQP